MADDRKEFLKKVENGMYKTATFCDGEPVTIIKSWLADFAGSTAMFKVKTLDGRTLVRSEAELTNFCL